jgi:hypothetical protein
MTEEQIANILRDAQYNTYLFGRNASSMIIDLANAIYALHEELEAERAKVARVRELHRPTPNIAECDIERGCTKCRSEWPCETILALNGEEMK